MQDSVRIWFLLCILSPLRAKFVERPDIKSYFNETHPIIVIGLPKSGTTSVTDFLQLSGVKAAHQFINMKHCEGIWPIPAVKVDNEVRWERVQTPTHKCFIGELIQLALSQKKPPLTYLFKAGFYAASQMDACYEVDLWPQIDALSFLMQAYPSAYFVHTIRDNITAHANSILHWSDLAHRMKTSGQLSRFVGQSSENSILQNIEVFIHNSQRIVKHHFRRYPNLRFLELRVSDSDSGLQLADFLHIKVEPDFKMPVSNVGVYDEKPETTFWSSLFG
jgi:hypothetical protein